MSDVALPRSATRVALGALQRNLRIFFFNHPEIALDQYLLIFWSSIQYVFCLYNTLLKVVSYYDLSVFSMPMIGFQKKIGGSVGGVSSTQVYFGFWHCKAPYPDHNNDNCDDVTDSNYKTNGNYKCS